MTEHERELAASLIQWWLEAGVDTLVEDTPRDWLAAPASARDVPHTPPPAERPPASGPAAVLSPAVEDSELPGDLEALVAWLGASDRLELLGPRRCPPQGQAGARLMLLADLPDTEDIAEGRLCSGLVGDLLDAMLKAIGETRESVYLASLSPGRPPSGQIDASLVRLLAPIARQHVALARPVMLLLMGEASAQALLGMTLAEARGRVHEIDPGPGRDRIRAVASFHPRFLLSQPERKADAWADLRRMMAAMAESPDAAG